jgi:hypothetical protein
MPWTGWLLGQSGLQGRDFSGGTEPRQVDLERSAFAGFAVQPDVAFALLDDAVYGGEAEACAFQSF